MGYYSEFSDDFQSGSGSELFIRIKDENKPIYVRLLPMELWHKDKPAPFFKEFVIWAGSNRYVSDETWGGKDIWPQLKREVDRIDKRLTAQSKSGMSLVKKSVQITFPVLQFTAKYAQEIGSKFLNAQTSLARVMMGIAQEYDDVGKFGIADLQKGYNFKLTRLGLMSWNMVPERQSTSVDPAVMDDLLEFDLIGKAEDRTLSNQDLMDAVLDWCEEEGVHAIENMP